MKGFDDHLDNYGDPNPGDEYADIDSHVEESSWPGDIPDDDPEKSMWYSELMKPLETVEDDEPCLLCGFYSCLCDGDSLPPVTAEEIKDDEEWDDCKCGEEDDDEDLGDPRPPGNLPYYPDEHDALIEKAQLDEEAKRALEADDDYAGVPADVDPDYTDDDGITTDDFDHWPLGREFPS